MDKATKRAFDRTEGNSYWTERYGIEADIQVLQERVEDLTALVLYLLKERDK